MTYLPFVRCGMTRDELLNHLRAKAEAHDAGSHNARVMLGLLTRDPATLAYHEAKLAEYFAAAAVDPVAHRREWGY